MPMSSEVAVAEAWMVDHCAAGIEGVVAKRLDEAYRPGGRTWRKIRTRNTAEAVVGGVLGSLIQPEALIVGCRDGHGRLHVSGRTTPLSPAAQSEAAVAEAWMVDHCAAGIEGAAAKRLDEANRPGGRTWRKIRTRNTAEAVVGGVLGPSSSRKALVVGCRDGHGRLHVSGRTTPLSPAGQSANEPRFSNRRDGRR